jgi:predicted DsbA family dithiol-disulfide isomerase
LNESTGTNTCTTTTTSTTTPTTTSSSTTATTKTSKKRLITGFAILRIPFFLEPNYDAKKVYIETNRQRLIHKWGGVHNWNIQKHRHQLKQRGEQVQIPHFNLDRLASNTMRSHRLIQYIGKRYGLSVSEYIYDILNQYHFVDGYALNDTIRLANTVHTALHNYYTADPTAFLVHDLQCDGSGTDSISSSSSSTQSSPTASSQSQMQLMSVEELIEFLNGTVGKMEIEQAVHLLHEYGIDGIPTFLLEGGQTTFQGAVHQTELVQAFRNIETRGYVLDETPIFQHVLQIPNRIVQHGSYRL